LNPERPQNGPPLLKTNLEKGKFGAGRL
jgi:hypothetical protein